LVERARALGYQPVVAESLLLSANVKSVVDSREDSLEDARLALLAAEAGRDDTRKATAEIQLAAWAREASPRRDTEHWLDLAAATLDRMHDDGILRAQWLEITAKNGGASDAEATKMAHQALDLARRSGATPEAIWRFERTAASFEACQGQIEEARRLADDADQIVIAAFGPQHPIRAAIFILRSFIAGQVQDWPGVVGYAQQVEELARIAGAGPADLVSAHINACEAFMHMGNAPAAVDDCAQAVAVGRRDLGASSGYLALAESNLGRALSMVHRDDEAVAHLATALDIYESQNGFATGHQAALLELGRAKLHARQAAEARDLLEKALALPVEEQELVPEISFALAQALWQTGVRTPRVRELGGAAVEGFRRSSREVDAREAEQWLAHTAAR
jgi:tetratricopeptide (TPR) repeat protein